MKDISTDSIELPGQKVLDTLMKKQFMPLLYDRYTLRQIDLFNVSLWYIRRFASMDPVTAVIEAHTLPFMAVRTRE